jgi:tetratricopeptide (TPR) repeat protein
LLHSREAVRLRPGLADVHLNLGNVLSTQGQFREAKSCYTEAMRLAPDLALSYNNMGQVFQAEGNRGEAVAWYRQALQRNPTSPRFRINLAVALTELEEFTEAMQHCQAVLSLDARCAEAHNSLGLIHIAHGRYDAAVRCFRSAIAGRADWDEAHANLGKVLKQLGEFDAALASLRMAVRINPKNASALAQVALTLRDRLPEHERTLLQQSLHDPNLREEERAALHFGMAQAHDACGDFAGAARHLERANGLQSAGLRQRGQPYDPAEHVREVDGLCEAFSATYLARVRGFGLPTEVPVFVVGLPRSGTTLVEHILASHARVFGAGEPNLVPRSLNALPRSMNRTETPLECLPFLSSAVASELAQRHLAWLREWDSSAERIVDKLPENYLALGWIATLFPRARIIHCRRDPRDIAFSCWMTHFSQVRWASDPRHITGRIAEYQRIMAHWRAVLPMPIFEVVYEELVADLEGVARRLIAFCNLDWDPNCLEFHKTRRPVTTASMMQVRRPLYTTSVGRWKHYQSLAAPLFAELNAALTKNGEKHVSVKA